MSNPNRASIKTRNSSVVSGIDKRVTGNMTLGGVVFTPAALNQVFLDENTAIDEAEALHKQWQDQVQATREVEAPKPKGPKTVAAKVVAAQKRDATRAVRHTMGKNQRVLANFDVRDFPNEIVLEAVA